MHELSVLAVALLFLSFILLPTLNAFTVPSDTVAILVGQTIKLNPNTDYVNVGGMTVNEASEKTGLPALKLSQESKKQGGDGIKFSQGSAVPIRVGANHANVKVTTFCHTGDSLSGGHMASGRSCPNDRDYFMALPVPLSKIAGKPVRVCAGSRCIVAPVWDVGPWCVNDQAYVFGNDRPIGEKLKGQYLPSNLACNHKYRSNGAGLDLSQALWYALGSPSTASWSFVEG